MFGPIVHRLRMPAAFLVMIILAIGFQPTTKGADVNLAVDESATPQQEATSEKFAQTPETKKEEDQEQKRAVTIGTILLAAIICAGLLLMLIVVVWGQRTRHLARTSLPKQTTGDDLWYLRPGKKPPKTESEDEAPKDAGSDDDEAESS